MKLGQTVYYLDFNDKSVKLGTIIDTHITNGGYSAYLIKTESGVVQREFKLAFDTQEKAEKKLIKLLPLAVTLEAYCKKCQQKSDKLRQKIIGKPDLEGKC